MATRMLRSHEVTPPRDPPAIQNSVWFNRTFQTTLELGTSPQIITVENLTSSTSVPLIRVLGFRVWADPGLATLTVRVMDPTSSTALRITEIADNGSYTTRPRVGFHYGEYISDKPLSSTAANEILEIITPVTGAAVVAVHCLFQFTS